MSSWHIQKIRAVIEGGSSPFVRTIEAKGPQRSILPCSQLYAQYRVVARVRKDHIRAVPCGKRTWDRLVSCQSTWRRMRLSWGKNSPVSADDRRFLLLSQGKVEHEQRVDFCDAPFRSRTRYVAKIFATSPNVALPALCNNCC